MEIAIEDILLQLMFNILKNCMNPIIIYLFFSEKMEIEQIEKLVAKFHEKEEYVIHIMNLKQALNYRLVLKKVQRVIEFNQKAWLKSYIDMNTELRKTM